jgi:MFS family permease
MRALRSTAPRRALAWAHVNGALWSAGNGLTSGTLIVYLALELGARGHSLSWILALPSLVGLLRLWSPPVLRWFGSLRRAAIALFAASYALLLLLPGVPWAGAIDPRFSPLAALALLLCAHQLLEHVGTVALWSWLGELVPPRIRGRYFARRQFWQLAVLVPTLAASGYWTDRWKQEHPERPWLGHVAFGTAGGLLLLASIVPLALMPDGARGNGKRLPACRSPAAAVAAASASASPPDAASPVPVRWWAPLVDPPFVRFLVFGCWFSFFNGLTQAAQNIYPRDVLGLGVLPMSLLRTGMRVGQLVITPAVGKAADRRGNRWVLAVSQALVGAGPLFFLLATPERPWWIVGAWVVWIAYAGTNVCLPNLALALSPVHDRTAHLAAHFALTSLAYAGSTVAGGYLHDWLVEARWSLALGRWRLDAYGVQFLGGWIARTATVFWLLRVPERR